MQITMSMEEYEDLKYESREEIRELELENVRLRKENEELTRENEELTREIFRLKTQNKEDLLEQSPIRKSAKPARKGGFFF